MEYVALSDGEPCRDPKAILKSSLSIDRTADEIETIKDHQLGKTALKKTIDIVNINFSIT